MIVVEEIEIYEVIFVKKMMKKECEKIIVKMEVEMKEVVKVLDFECVVELRDLLLELKVEGWKKWVRVRILLL